MTEKREELLKSELALMHKAQKKLEYSYEVCRKISDKDKYTYEEEDRFEALTSRFARLSDILIQKIFRLIESLEMEKGGTVRDRINRVEKWGIIESADDYLLIRELRNSIAHEYLPEVIYDIYKQVLRFTPLLFETVENVDRYCKKFLE